MNINELVHSLTAVAEEMTEAIDLNKIRTDQGCYACAGAPTNNHTHACLEAIHHSEEAATHAQHLILQLSRLTPFKHLPYQLDQQLFISLLADPEAPMPKKPKKARPTRRLNYQQKVWFPSTNQDLAVQPRTHAKYKGGHKTYCGINYKRRAARNTTGSVECLVCIAALDKEGIYVTADC